jgi:hypothetical protein
MTIKDFKRVVNIISKTATDEGFWLTINNLSTTLNQYVSQKLTNANSQNLVQQRNSLDSLRIQVLNNITSIYNKIIDNNELHNFNTLNLNDVFGEGAIKLLRDLIHNTEINAADANTNFRTFHTKVSTFQNLQTNLNQVLGGVEIDENEEPDNLITIYFENGADIENLKQLSKSSNEWNQIINFISRLVRDNNTETKIMSIRRGSLILTIGAVPAIILGVTKAFDKVLDLILKVYEIKKSAIELRKLNVSAINDTLDLLEKQSRLNVKTEATKISEELLKEFAWKEDDTSYNETKISVEQAVKKIIKFSNSGGKIEVKLITSNEDEKSEDKKAVIYNLKQKTEQFRIEEAKIIQLQGAKELLQLDGEEEHPNI